MDLAPIEMDAKFLDDYKAEFLKELLVRIEQKTPVAPSVFEHSGKLKASWEGTIEGDSIYIDNTAINKQGVRYWGFLEYGTEDVTPVAMVRRSIMESADIAAIARRKAGK